MRATQLSLIGCESLGCLCISAGAAQVFHYGAPGDTLGASTTTRSASMATREAALSTEMCF